MSRQNLENLLDSMLDESATQLEADEQREREEREARRREAAAMQPKAQASPDEPPSFDDVNQLTGLPEADLRQVLAKAAPDDLLVVLATAGDVLQRRILSNLSADSVRWLRDNLQHMERVTDAERDGARGKLLKVANQLLAEGTIGLPEPESVGAEEAPEPEDKGLRELLTDLVRIAEQAGPEALGEVAESAGEPLLRDGLRRVAGGSRGDALRGELTELCAALEQRYAQRLRWMLEAVVAVAEGETAESFRQRLFEE